MPGQQFLVEIAERLSEALGRLRRGGLDVVLLDLSLPDSTGIHTVLKVRECSPEIPIIILTGSDDEELAAEAIKIGAQDYLVKGTVDERLLTRSIRYAVYRLSSEQVLKEQRRRLQLLMASIPDCRIYFKDGRGRFLEVNNAFVKQYGLRDAGEAIGKTDFDLFTEEHASMAAKDEEVVFRTGQPLVGKVEKETMPDGVHTWALTTKIPLHNENGRIIGTFGISRDVTALKDAEERLIEANEKLSAVFSDLLQSHEQLKATQLQLIQAEKLKSLGQMAAGVAHEVKNPLANLRLGIEFIGGLSFSEDQQINEVLAEMKASADRAEAVIRDMLDYSSARDLQLREVSVNALISHTLRFVKHEIAKAKVKVIAGLDEHIGSCLLDSGKIEQVLINVFTNACHAMPDGGSLTITTSQKDFESEQPDVERGSSDSVHSGKANSLAVIQIRDSGTGIPEDKLSKIFDPFFTTKAIGLGSGLGLAVVKKIVDMHGGTISIENNTPERGACVTIMFRRVSNGDETKPLS